MLKENERLYNNVLGVIDLLLSLLAFVLAYYVRVFAFAKSIIYSDQYIILALTIIPIWFILLKAINIQGGQRIKAYPLILIEYAISVFIGISILFILIFILKL